MGKVENTATHNRVCDLFRDWPSYHTWTSRYRRKDRKDVRGINILAGIRSIMAVTMAFNHLDHLFTVGVECHCMLLYSLVPDPAIPASVHGKRTIDEADAKSNKIHHPKTPTSISYSRRCRSKCEVACNFTTHSPTLSSGPRVPEMKEPLLSVLALRRFPSMSAFVFVSTT